MTEPCPECGTTMLPADDFDCEKVDWVCPDCARDFVLEGATTEETLAAYRNS